MKRSAKPTQAIVPAGRGERRTVLRTVDGGELGVVVLAGKRRLLRVDEDTALMWADELTLVVEQRRRARGEGREALRDLEVVAA